MWSLLCNIGTNQNIDPTAIGKEACYVLDLFAPHSSNLFRAPPKLRRCVPDMRSELDRSSRWSEPPLLVNLAIRVHRGLPGIVPYHGPLPKSIGSERPLMLIVMSASCLLFNDRWAKRVWLECKFQYYSVMRCLGALVA